MYNEVMGDKMSFKKSRILVIIITIISILCINSCSFYSSVFGSIIKKYEYNNWLKNKKKKIDEIGKVLGELTDKNAIENEFTRLVNEGLDVEWLYIGFSDNTIFNSEYLSWYEDFMLTECDWYKLAIGANGNVVETELYESDLDGETYIAIVKYLGTIDGLNVVLGEDVIVPHKFLNKKKRNENNLDSKSYTELDVNKISEYNVWLETQKKLIGEVATHFTNSNNIKYIEENILEYCNNGTDFVFLYVLFSNNTAICSDLESASFYSELIGTDWYVDVLNGNGDIIEANIYEGSLAYYNRIITIAKYIGAIEGLTAVLAVDIFIPEDFFE